MIPKCRIDNEPFDIRPKAHLSMDLNFNKTVQGASQWSVCGIGERYRKILRQADCVLNCKLRIELVRTKQPSFGYRWLITCGRTLPLRLLDAVPSALAR